MRVLIKKVTLFFMIALMGSHVVLAQKKDVSLNLTLDQAIELAFNQSIFGFRQKHMYLARYWGFRSYKASKLPKLNFSSTLINYNRSIETQLIDREKVLVPVEDLSSSASLGLSQNIIATGGTISMSSSLNRIENSESGNVSYGSVPISIKISQPIGGYNEFKWTSKIEPLKFEQAKREYLQNLQELSRLTTNVFFDLKKAEINLEIGQTNVSNADTLYKIGKGRFEIGTVTQDELLDLELGYLNADMALSKSKVELEQARSKINSFLGFDDNVNIECVLPSEIPSFKIKVDEALEMAIENNPEILNFQQQLIEADRDVANAKGKRGIEASVSANLGYNKAANKIDGAYKSPFKNDQGLGLTLGVPILDWGQRRGNIQMARSNKQVTEAIVRQAKIDFDQNIFLQVMEFNMQEQQVKIAAKADIIAQRGYEVTKQRFLIDKVDVIKLNAAQKSVDAAKRNYIQNVQTYWSNYFNIRKSTLYDFEKKQTLIKELEGLLQN